MPTPLVGPAAETIAPAIAEPLASSTTPAVRRPRSVRRPIAVVIGLIVLSTVLLLALAVVALTDRSDSPIATIDTDPSLGRSTTPSR